MKSVERLLAALLVVSPAGRIAYYKATGTARQMPPTPPAPES